MNLPFPLRTHVVHTFILLTFLTKNIILYELITLIFLQRNTTHVCICTRSEIALNCSFAQDS